VTDREAAFIHRKIAEESSGLQPQNLFSDCVKKRDAGKR
jgi:hypothetical protein